MLASLPNQHTFFPIISILLLLVNFQLPNIILYIFHTSQSGLFRFPPTLWYAPKDFLSHHCLICSKSHAPPTPTLSYNFCCQITRFYIISPVLGSVSSNPLLNYWFINSLNVFSPHIFKIILSSSAIEHVALLYVSTGLTVFHILYCDIVNKKFHENRIENE